MYCIHIVIIIINGFFFLLRDLNAVKFVNLVEEIRSKATVIIMCEKPKKLSTRLWIREVDTGIWNLGP